jgi:hypothetical protein
MHDASAQNDTVGSNHLGDRQGGGNLHHRDACFFEFRRDRSAAARAGPSRRRKDDRIDAVLLDLLGHLPAQTPRVRQRIGPPAG